MDNETEENNWIEPPTKRKYSSGFFIKYSLRWLYSKEYSVTITT